VAFIVAAVALAGVAVYHDRVDVSRAWHRIGPGGFALSLLLGLLGMGATYPTWREVLLGLGVDLPLLPGSRVFFVSQIGKYIPGSVWPVLMQMDAGRRRGASRRTMLAANLLAIAVNCSVGLTVACVVLAVDDPDALARYWWALALVPVLLAMLHPRALTGILDRVLALVHRPPLHERLRPGSTVRSAAWSVTSWVLLGLQLGVLTAAVDHGGASTYLLCIGAMALAVPAGVLFIPAPAGAGIRDVVLVLVLRPRLGSGEALAVVVAARAVLIVCDLLLAGLTALVGRRVGSGSPVPERGGAGASTDDGPGSDRPAPPGRMGAP
jgi:uncharacterized membrane protein YbhN (UPF0104 family)